MVVAKPKYSVLFSHRVVIQIGGYNDFSPEIIDLNDRATSSEDCDSADFNGEAERFQPEFDVDWCSFKLVSNTHKFLM